MVPTGVRTPGQKTAEGRVVRSPTVATTSIAQQRARSRSVRTGIDLVLIGVLGALLIRVFLWPTLRHHYPFPVGPDVPVYLWWTRVAEYGGISMASERPGAPALIGTLQGVLGQGVVGALAGLQYALGPTIGLAAAAEYLPSAPASNPEMELQEEKTTTNGSRWREGLRALRHRNYRLFFSGQTVSLIGTWSTKNCAVA